MAVHVWEPEVDGRCVLQLFSPLFTASGLFLNPAFTDSARWPAHPEDLLCLPPEASGLQAGSHTH